MLKNILNMLAGALIAASVSAAFAVGFVPVPGYQTPDGAWLLGVVGGQNFTYQYGIVAKAGGTQATCTPITPGIYLNQIDTVATTNDSACLPFAIAGYNLNIRNNGAQTMALYAQAGTNLVTAATDTINNASNTASYTIVAQNSVECFAAKSGVWSCVQGH